MLMALPMDGSWYSLATWPPGNKRTTSHHTISEHVLHRLILRQNVIIDDYSGVCHCIIVIMFLPALPLALSSVFSCLYHCPVLPLPNFCPVSQSVYMEINHFCVHIDLCISECNQNLWTLKDTIQCRRTIQWSWWPAHGVYCCRYLQCSWWSEHRGSGRLPAGCRCTADDSRWASCRRPPKSPRASPCWRTAAPVVVCSQSPCGSPGGWWARCRADDSAWELRWRRWQTSALAIGTSSAGDLQHHRDRKCMLPEVSPLHQVHS